MLRQTLSTEVSAAKLSPDALEIWQHASRILDAYEGRCDELHSDSERYRIQLLRAREALRIAGDSARSEVAAIDDILNIRLLEPEAVAQTGEGAPLAAAVHIPVRAPVGDLSESHAPEVAPETGAAARPPGGPPDTAEKPISPVGPRGSVTTDPSVERNEEFEAAIQHLDADLQTFARINFYDRDFPLNPHRRPLTSAEVKQVLDLVETLRHPVPPKGA